MTANHSSIQKLLTICCSCTACQNSANSRVDVGRQQCITRQLMLEIADVMEEHDVDSIEFVCTVPFLSIFFSNTV